MRDEIYIGALFSSDYLAHYGKGHDDNPPGRGSGRYPYGSGKRPHQHEPEKQGDVADVAKYAFDTNPTISWLRNAMDAGVRTVKEFSLNRRITEFDQRVSKQPVDTATGLHLKTKHWTIEEDVKAVNPEFEDYDERGDNLGITNNCVYCAFAYDMRRRGYDVRAKSRLGGEFPESKVKTWYKNAVVYFSNHDDPESTIRFLTRQGDGARGFFAFNWVGVPYGHCMTYEVIGKKLYLHDPQSGQAYLSLNELASDIDFETAATCRLDNLEINPSKVKEFCK